MLPQIWMQRLEHIDYAFQPIVNPFTGMTSAVEALIRGVEKAGFADIDHFFEEAYQQNISFHLEQQLRRKVFEKFITIPFYKKIKIFYNYDPRVHFMLDYKFGFTEELLLSLDLKPYTVCYELSEKSKYELNDFSKHFLKLAKQSGYYIALDDFGVGFSGLELFYNTEPDFIKFDRFLIREINEDRKKRAFCSHLISLAKVFGIMVIAEGVETRAEYETCRNLGFDLVQGYCIQKPQLDVLKLKYEYVTDSLQQTFLSLPGEDESREEIIMIRKEIKPLETIRISDGIKSLFDFFHKNSEQNFLPVLDENDYPLGIIHEKSIKEYIYAPYGYDLSCNRPLHGSLYKFIEKCPLLDIRTSMENLLEIFMQSGSDLGILIYENSKYVGFLSSRSLLNLQNEKNLHIAREMNPLTKLNGNTMINRYIADAFQRREKFQYFIYLDFDNFKPFNDRFGFQQGDRVILLFADMLRQDFSSNQIFLGHIGGDDFFVGINCDHDKSDYVQALTESLIHRFEDTAATYYSPEEREQGYYEAISRENEIRRFPLLNVSAAVVSICQKFFYNNSQFTDEISIILSDIKKKAKKSPEKVVCQRLSELEMYSHSVVAI